MAGRIWIASNEDFVRVLRGLLPRGLLWTKEPARRLTALLQGVADELVRVHNSAGNLLEEADPQTTTGLLSDWERVAGLPEFGYVPTTQAARRTTLVGKLAARGGSSETYFRTLAVSYGATGDVDVNDGPSRFVWTVCLPDNVIRFRAGTGRAGDRVAAFDEVAERIIRAFEHYKPAHTRIFWTD